MPGIAVAGLSVRVLAESARAGGLEVVGLDLFGDRDTRAACVAWHGIGDAASLRIDPQLFEAALAGIAFEGPLLGWVPGSGFEDDPSLLCAGGAALPCLGMAPAQVRRLRTPSVFFGALERYGIPYPTIALEAPASPQGWLAKRAGGCGGVHVQPMPRGGGARHADTYWQRFQPGTPMSALFLADGERALVVGLNRQLVQAVGDRPYVYAGAIGPVRAPALAAAVESALARLVPEFGLRGLASLDFIADGDALHVLEINPRPSASMQLHDDACAGGLVRAHLAAVGGVLPALAPRRVLRGHRVVFAERELMIDHGLSQALSALGCHDLPLPGARMIAGEPVCSVGALAGAEAGVDAALQQRMATVQHRLAAGVESTRECMA